MTQDNLKELIEKIKANYKFLIEPDQEIKLEDILKIFKISIDLSRKEDYTIDLIDPENLSIEITDKKNNIKYKSQFSDEMKLLNNREDRKKYINLQIIGPTYTIHKDYLIRKDNPLIEKLIITEGKDILEFIKRYPYSGWFFINERIHFDIDYSTSENGEKNRLLTKSYEEYNIGDIKISYEQFENTPYDYIGVGTDQKKFIYTQNNCVVYGINELKHSYYNTTKGLFIENTSESNYCEFPIGMYEDKYPELLDKDVKSAVILQGYGYNIHNYIELYKRDKKAMISYSIFNTSGKGPASKQHIEQEIELLCEGPITSDEIKIIVESLQEKYPDNVFINILNDELSIFGDILEKRNTSQIELLTPKIYFDKKLEDIAVIVTSNKEEFFKSAKEQFDASREKERYTPTGYELIKKPQKKDDSNQ